jgi:integrase
MGTIFERPRRDGTIAFTAQISIMRNRKVALRETKTFDRRPAAVAWLKRREKELERPDGVNEAIAAKKASPRTATLASAIDRYVSESEKEIGRTKAQVLRSIKDFDIGGMACADITSIDIIRFAREKLAGGAKPQTVGNYLSHLAAVFSIARPAWGYALDSQAMDDAWAVAKKLGIAKKSDHRDRRPTLDELGRLMEHFGDRSVRRPDSAPMRQIIGFAIFSTRRQEEITRIEWRDLDRDRSRVLVCDMKNPGEKKGNDVLCDLPAEALQIIDAMPRTDARIFPYTTDAISAAFTRACALLGIDDMHFHDLRHDGVSRLFEIDYTIPRAAAVSGHRSWNSLKRYTHLSHSGDKYAGWKWLSVITSPPAPRPD